MRLTSWVLMGLCAAGCARGAEPRLPTIYRSGDLPWRQEFVVWPASENEPKPWRSDPRLKGRFFSEEYPDDIEVVFVNPDRTDNLRNERMWVTVLAYDPYSDLFLGALGNEPYAMHNVAEGDNVIFLVDPSVPAPFAFAEDGRYDIPGWPPAKPGSLDAALIAGIRAYRRGHYGNNQPEMKKCAETLRGALKQPAANVPPRRLQLAYFVLGRCLAEMYVTREAMASFAKAVELDPTDCHARVSLAAEHSVMAFKADFQAPEGARFWEQKYLDAIADVRSHCSPEDASLFDLALKTGKKQAEANPKDPNAARAARIGAGVVREKSR